MIVGLRFNIRISQKENRQDDDNDIPTGEDQPTDTIVSESATQKKSDGHAREGIDNLSYVCWVIPSREGDHRRNLEKTNLQCIRRPNFHTARDDVLANDWTHGRGSIP